MQIMQLKLPWQEDNASGRKVMNAGGAVQLTSPPVQCKCQALTNNKWERTFHNLPIPTSRDGRSGGGGW